MKKTFGIKEFEEWGVLSYAMSNSHIQIFSVSTDIKIDTDKYNYNDDTEQFEIDQEFIDYLEDKDFEEFLKPFDLECTSIETLKELYNETKTKRKKSIR